jgi:predicted ribonuclease YlaK
MGNTNFDVVVSSLDTNTTVKANAATATMKDYDFEKNNTNTGASGTIVLTLPSASSLKGQKTRIQITAAQIVQLLPATGEKIYLGGDGVASKYLQIAGTIGNYAELYCDGTSFYVTGYSGVLTKEG